MATRRQVLAGTAAAAVAPSVFADEVVCGFTEADVQAAAEHLVVVAATVARCLQVDTTEYTICALGRAMRRS